MNREKHSWIYDVLFLLVFVLAGYLSEVFMDTPFGRGVGRLVVDRFSYFVYTSDAREIAELESLANTGLTYEAAIEKMVEKYRS